MICIQWISGVESQFAIPPNPTECAPTLGGEIAKILSTNQSSIENSYEGLMTREKFPKRSGFPIDYSFQILSFIAMNIFTIIIIIIIIV